MGLNLIFVMHLLELILKKARELNTHDLHFIPQHNGKPVILYRQGKTTIQKEFIDAQPWRHLIEYLKFHSHYRYDSSHSFQDLSLKSDDYSLRLAFAPGLNPYITCRLHQPDLSLTLSPLIDLIEKNWTGLLLIAGPIKSGKTTLYYELLKRAALAQSTIMSLEDPIERLFDTFTQHSVHPKECIHQTTQALLRFDLDVVGFGEVRSLDRLNLLTTLSMATINTICTLHAGTIETLARKLTMLSRGDYERFYSSFYGAFLIKNLFDSPIFYPKDDPIFHNIFSSTSFSSF
jgi:type II secretory ATPase GspE/PulE/Tfp pilus assembly ATPase PilB-like protein